MVAVPSTMLKLQTQAPSFDLKDVTKDKVVSIDDYDGYKAYLVIFMCNHCPYVKHILPKLVPLCNKLHDQGVAIFAISSNDVNHYPEDNPQKMAQLATKEKFNFPYLHDEDQSVAKAYKAACTPDFFLFNAAKKLVYRGQFDDSRPGNDKPVTGESLAKAVDEALKGVAPHPEEQKPSTGCNIKWIPGNEPEYFTS